MVNNFNSDFCLETKNNTLTILSKNSIDVSINVLDTGLDTQTGGRLKRLENFVQSSRFFLTYGDGVCNVNLQKLVNQHEKLGALATVTAVHPTSRYGKISIENDDIDEESREIDYPDDEHADLLIPSVSVNLDDIDDDTNI